MACSPGKPHRVSGFTIRGNATFYITGACTDFRIDHNRFENIPNGTEAVFFNMGESLVGTAWWTTMCSRPPARTSVRFSSGGTSTTASDLEALGVGEGRRAAPAGRSGAHVNGRTVGRSADRTRNRRLRWTDAGIRISSPHAGREKDDHEEKPIEITHTSSISLALGGGRPTAGIHVTAEVASLSLAQYPDPTPRSQFERFGP